MKVESIDELEAVLRLCHRQGVHNIVIDNIQISLTPQDPDALKASSVPLIDGREMSDDELLFYSSTK